MTELGRLTRMNLREVWRNEATHFTPWLAQEDNLRLLGETLGIELELEAVEQNVGLFRADILCKELQSGAWVLVENQLEKTDHTHLGQLITYASGLEAVTLVWIADVFTDEHRGAIQWLNSITDEQFNFFAVEVELWQIGDSAPAPKFNIAAKPNNWSRSIRRAARQISEAGTSEETKLRQRYWTALAEHLRETGSVDSIDRPTANTYVDFPIDYEGSAIVAFYSRTKGGPGVFLRMRGEDAEALYHLIEERAEQLETELGLPLRFRVAKPRDNYHVTTRLPDDDPTDPERWPRLIDWTARSITKFREIFEPLLRQLDPDSWAP